MLLESLTESVSKEFDLIHKHYTCVQKSRVNTSMQLLKSIFSTSSFQLRPKSCTIFLLYYSSSSASSSAPVLNLPFLDYLVKNLYLTRTQALSLSNRYPRVKSFEKTQSVANFFQSLGFSNAQIASAICNAPQLLFANVEKNLRPKVKLFHDLGLAGPYLCEFFSSNSALLCCSLDKKLIPCVQIIKKVLGDSDHEILIKVFKRSNGFISRDSIMKVSNNIEYLESCGIVGCQLSMLLTRQPRIFRTSESALRDLVSKVINMGLSTDSRMLVHAIHSLDCLSEKTFKKKWELLKSYGFSEDDCRDIFRKCPSFYRTSADKLKLGIEFFTNVAKVDKKIVVSRPVLFMHSLEDQVIPRYRILQIIKSKMLLKKELSFLYILDLTEKEFLKFISRFTNDVEELLMAYKGNLLHTSSLSSSEEEDTR